MSELAGGDATADLVDHYGDRLASVAVQFRSFGLHRRFSGPAVTVRCLEDNALLKRVLTEEPDPAGMVLVVDGGGSYRSALVGDVIAGIAVERGWAGLVIHGVVRDSVALDALPIGIKALGTNPAKSSKTGSGETGRPVDIGGVSFHPGARVFADEDGIVVLDSALG
ncbi:MAG TPA: ribonuclease E activity regulator RraA [Propionibacteriaceae bacterium]|nr:ribonuclease E activity regulator RraA [Propionibacteriaceae bacterium]